MSEAITF